VADARREGTAIGGLEKNWRCAAALGVCEFEKMDGRDRERMANPRFGSAKSGRLT